MGTPVAVTSYRTYTSLEWDDPSKEYLTRELGNLLWQDDSLGSLIERYNPINSGEIYSQPIQQEPIVWDENFELNESPEIIWDQPF